ncbi:MAG TPA: serine/threonine-protein kinase [Pyrinomonadaceae bacterium]|jgi:serine/threonine protein kinase
MIKAGEVLQGRYRIEKQIGAGGMGAVFVATDERFGSTVAIKETLFTDERLLKAFEREARLLNSLRHPALPRVSDHFVDENGQFIVMEYIAGDDLAEMMEQRSGAFALEDVLKWADQLLDALDFLHTQEMPVIHRDIKPQNLKLTPRGQIILLDFGLAKGSVTNAESLTAAKSVFGYSRNYASLEQIQGTGTDPRSDLYSLAATLYHLMTGAPPSDALTRAMSVLNGEKDPLIPAHHLNAEIPAGISEVLNRAMALNANHRPSSAAAMRELLRDGVSITDSEEFTPVADASSTASLFTQKTAVMADESRASSSELNTSILPVADFSKQTETENETSVKTNVVKGDSNPNKSTTIQPLAEMTQTGGNQKSRFATAAMVLGVLLVLGSVASALYVFKPEIFQQQGETPNGDRRLNPADAPKNESNGTGSVPNTDSIVTAAAANTNTSAANPTVETAVTTKKENLPKADEKASSEIPPAAKNNSRDAKPQSNQPEVRVIERADENMGDDEVKMTDNRIETKDLIIDEKGDVKFKNPKMKSGGARVYNIRPFLTPEQMRRMTPEQKEKLRKLMEIHRAMPKFDPPTPPAPQPKPSQD